MAQSNPKVDSTTTPNSSPNSNLLSDNNAPLVLSKYFSPIEIPYTSVDFSPVKWYFMPGLRFDIPFFITVLAVVIAIVGFVIVGQKQGKSGLIALLVLQFIAATLGVIRVNIGWNNNLRTNICHCYSKSQQAKALWAPETAHERLLQKDLFHEESGVGYRIRVLRDGSVEMHAGALGETLQDGMTKAANDLRGIGSVPEPNV